MIIRCNPFRSSLIIIVAALIATFVPLCAAEDAPKVLNPWKQLPMGTILEFAVATDTSVGFPQKTTHTEIKEVWKVVSNNGLMATIEMTAGDTRRQWVRELTPVDPMPEPPSEIAGTQPTATRATNGQDQTTVLSDRVETPIGTFDGVRINHRRMMFESESHGSEWRVLGFPEPLKSVNVHSSVSGTLMSTTVTRTMTRFDVPGSTWGDFAVGTTFDVQVEKEHRQLYPKGQQPAADTSVEHWKLLQKKDRDAVFQVSTATSTEESSLPIVMYGPPAAGTTSSNQGMEIHTQITRELISTPLGNFYGTRNHDRMVMNEAGGEGDEWRVAGFPLPLKSRNLRKHKEQEDTETRTVVRLEAASPAKK